MFIVFVDIVWVAGHFVVTVDETADKLAKQVPSLELITPEPVVEITAMTVCTEVQS